MLSDLNVGVAKISSDVTVVCTRASDFDPVSNILFELEANRSAVRPDVHCFKCASVMVMSNDAYARYAALDKKPRVTCLQCLVESTEGTAG